MGESMKCGRCDAVLIREERTNKKFLDLGRKVFGDPLCFVCFEEMAPELLEEVSG